MRCCGTRGISQKSLQLPKHDSNPYNKCITDNQQLNRPRVKPHKPPWTNQEKTEPLQLCPFNLLDFHRRAIEIRNKQQNFIATNSPFDTSSNVLKNEYKDAIACDK